MAGGLIGHKDITQGLAQMLLQGEKKMKVDVQEAALDAGIAGAEEIRRIISTTESSLSPGKMDRIWTSKMLHSVDSTVDRKGTTISIRAGWLETKEPYFLIQNDGGDLVRNGVTTTIVPMDALWAGRTEMLKTLTRWGLKEQ